MALVAFIGSLALTGLVRRLALRWGFVDQPGHRKIHDNPIALGGGIVIFWLTIVPLALAAALVLYWQNHPAPAWLPAAITMHLPGLAQRAPALLAMVGAATLLHITGLIDDRRHLGPGIKLLVQFAAAILLATMGHVRFDFFIANQYITTFLSIIWIIVIINAFNFLDNMDGLSVGIAVICAAMILAAAWSGGQVFVCFFLALVIAVLLGFLVWNFHPAKIFMGDSGSLLVGLFLAVATVRTTYYHTDASGGHVFATLIPLIVLAIPLYDFISVTIIRILQGKSPFVGDTQHFSHRLVKRGMTQPQAVLTIYLATACTGLGATILHQVSTMGVILIFIQTILIIAIIAVLELPGPKLR